MIPLPAIEGGLSQFLTKEAAHEITRAPIARALTITGETGHPVGLVRLAYIQRVRGAKHTQSVIAAVNEPADIACGEFWSSKTARAIINDAFERAHAVAFARWEAEHAAILDGRRFPGRVLAALRTSMGLDQETLAERLRVSRESVRDWERGVTLINEGAASDVVQMWQDWYARLEEHVDATPEGAVPMFPPGTPVADLRAAMLMTGEVVTIDPGPLVQPTSAG